MYFALQTEPTNPPSQEPPPTDPTPPTCIEDSVLYTGQLCRQELHQRQNCLLEGSAQNFFLPEDDIFIPSSTNLTAVKQTAEMLVQSLPLLNPSLECEAAFRNFMCLWLFGMCSNDGGEVSVTREECMEVSTMLCPREWEVARQYLDETMLPKCAKLPQGGGASCTGE